MLLKHNENKNQSLLLTQFLKQEAEDIFRRFEELSKNFNSLINSKEDPNENGYESLFAFSVKSKNYSKFQKLEDLKLNSDEFNSVADYLLANTQKNQKTYQKIIIAFLVSKQYYNMAYKLRRRWNGQEFRYHDTRDLAKCHLGIKRCLSDIEYEIQISEHQIISLSNLTKDINSKIAEFKSLLTISKGINDAIFIENSISSLNNIVLTTSSMIKTELNFIDIAKKSINSETDLHHSKMEDIIRAFPESTDIVTSKEATDLDIKFKASLFDRMKQQDLPPEDLLITSYTAFKFIKKNSLEDAEVLYLIDKLITANKQTTFNSSRLSNFQIFNGNYSLNIRILIVNQLISLAKRQVIDGRITLSKEVKTRLKHLAIIGNENLKTDPRGMFTSALRAEEYFQETMNRIKEL